MSRRQRNRMRARHAAEASSRHVAPERESPPAYRGASHRPARSSRTGFSRAVGAPSQSLERAAILERGFIVKDFRRLAVVVVFALVVLVLAGVAESALLK